MHDGTHSHGYGGVTHTHEHEHEGITHTHEHGHGHTHEHEHEGITHTHEHGHGHTHEHEHEGITHTHEHDHDHAHEHGAGGSARQAKPEMDSGRLAAVLGYMKDHNREHAGELTALLGSVRELGSPEIEGLIAESAKSIDAAADGIEKALGLLARR
ncbi:MAG: hypothetical protein LBG82_00145 [Clostridiales Family XIII bacterium]|jgi:hypothetical protein|nr:hypothetical protein [Clostridiales Family XIII bacterium]